MNKYLLTAYYAPGAGNTAMSKMANIPVPMEPKRNTHKISVCQRLIRVLKLE